VKSDDNSIVKSFKIFDQTFNSKILKFIKVLNCTMNESMVGNVLDCRSVSLEYISLMRLRQIYINFLSKFATKIQEDMQMLLQPESAKHYFAIVYRLENKKIIIL
jgi:hypothetical protein